MVLVQLNFVPDRTCCFPASTTLQVKTFIICICNSLVGPKITQLSIKIPSLRFKLFKWYDFFYSIYLTLTCRSSMLRSAVSNGGASPVQGPSDVHSHNTACMTHILNTTSSDSCYGLQYYQLICFLYISLLLSDENIFKVFLMIF